MLPDPVEELRQNLFARAAGPIAEPLEVANLLLPVWHLFHGHNETKMENSKLGRIEDAKWDPPILSFCVERHGAACFGSTLAEVQQWNVNIDEMTALPEHVRNRQIYPREPKLDTAALAKKAVKLVQKGKRHPWLKWKSAERVQIMVGKIIEPRSACKETVKGRRKRLAADLENGLYAIGWMLVPNTSPHVYQKMPEAGAVPDPQPKVRAAETA